PTRRGELLQAGLVIPAAGTGHGLGDALAQTAQHEITGGREIAIEVDGGNDRFERVGEDRLLRAPACAVFAFAEQQVRAELDLLRDLGEHERVHDARAHFRQLALGEIGEGRVYLVGD